MPNLKIMVNFKARKIIHTSTTVGSSEYQYLLSKGYEKVGTAKVDEYSEIKFFWDETYFNPSVKYLALKIKETKGN